MKERWATVFSLVGSDLVGCRKTLKSYDLFGDQKRCAYTDSEAPVRSLTTYLCDTCARVDTGCQGDVDELFSEFVEVSWFWTMLSFTNMNNYMVVLQCWWQCRKSSPESNVIEWCRNILFFSISHWSFKIRSKLNELGYSIQNNKFDSMWTLRRNWIWQMGNVWGKRDSSTS